MVTFTLRGGERGEGVKGWCGEEPGVCPAGASLEALGIGLVEKEEGRAWVLDEKAGSHADPGVPTEEPSLM